MRELIIRSAVPTALRFQLELLPSVETLG